MPCYYFYATNDVISLDSLHILIFYRDYAYVKVYLYQRKKKKPMFPIFLICFYIPAPSVYQKLLYSFFCSYYGLVQLDDERICFKKELMK